MIRRVVPALVLFATISLFGRALVSMSFSESPLIDDGMNAALALSFAHGFGYATHYPDPTPFDVTVTTGPALLMPAALGMVLTRDAYFAPMLTSAILNLLLLALLLVLVARGGRPGYAHPLVAAFCLAALILRGYEGGASPFSHWFTLLGEVPGFLLLAIGTLLVFEDEPGPRLWLGALAIGTAPLAKLVYAVPAAGIMAVVALRLILRRPRWRAPLAVGATLAPPAAWELFKLGSLGKAAYIANSAARAKFIFWNLQGPASTGVIGDPIDALLLRFSTLTQMLGGAVWMVSWFVVALVVLVLLLAGGRSPGRPWRAPSLALFGAAIVLMFLWEAVATSAWSRYAFTGELCMVLAVSLGVASLRWARLRMIVGAAWLLCCSAQIGGAASTLWMPPSEPSPRLAALLETAAFLRKLAPDPYVAMGGSGPSANWDLQYPLGMVGRLSDLSRWMLPPVRHKILVRSEFWNLEARPAPVQLAVSCDAAAVLLERPPFRVSQCF